MDLRDIQRMLFKHYKQKGFYDKWKSIYPDWAADLAELALITSEVSEAMEEVRDNNFEGLANELAGIVIRVLNFASRKGIDLETNILSEHKRNLSRPSLHGRKNI